MIALTNNPIQEVVGICNRLYPDKNCDLIFVEGIKEKVNAWAVTEWNGGSLKPWVCIDVSAPYSAVIELIAHEFAHVVAGEGVGHGSEWEAVFDRINMEFNRE